MSKALTASKSNTNKQEIQPKANLPEKTSLKSAQLPSIREVNVPAVNKDQQLMITAYKDLNQPALDFAKNQRKHLLIAFLFFFALGIGIMMGQSKSRQVASADLHKLIPENATPVTNEHYLYEKSCYKGANGEDVCVTRSSRKNN